MKICIIGAGTAGLVSARHALEHNFEPIVLEQSECIGGTWVYNENVGTVNCIDIHSSMYKNLRTNLPKEVMGYPDYPIKGCEESYVPSHKICGYLEEYAKHFNLTRFIRFNTYVIRIARKALKWQVIFKDLISNECYINYFEYVLVGSGHYHTPMFPNIPNMEQFKGKVLHSHDFRCPQNFKGESVLIVGAGPSGMDLSNIISRSADNVTLSHHSNEIRKSTFFSNVDHKPDIQKLDTKGAYFIDGSYKEYDNILFCTGYSYSFPFLSLDCGIYVENNFVQILYKHCINARNVTMAFVGIPFYVCAAQMMDLQSRFVLKIFRGQKSLPPIDKLIADTKLEMEVRWKKGYKRRQAHMMGPDQFYYYQDLSETAEIENLKPVMTWLHNESSQDFNRNLMHFREDNFRIIDNDTFVKIN